MPTDETFVAAEFLAPISQVGERLSGSQKKVRVLTSLQIAQKLMDLPPGRRVKDQDAGGFYNALFWVYIVASLESFKA